jgi:general secretion pathway protein I
MNLRRRRGRCRGFTLLEVLIALAIVALAVGALLGTITSSASNVIYLKDKTLAEWVALNRLTEIRIAQQMPDVGDRTGNAEMGGMRWQWEQEVSELPIKGMYRIDVRARPTGETVDDSRAVDQPKEQKETDSTASGSEIARLSWTTTVTGVVSSARSDRRNVVAAPLRGDAGIGAGPNGGKNPGSPGGAPTPGSPLTPAPSPAPDTDPPPVQEK